VIPQRSAEQAITLADQGWNVSEIARHLGHDRKTIRIYLNGSRKPGQPRPQADSFASFAGYAARRLRDDPHLRAAGLHRELAELGYLGSYSALTRELRNSAIHTTCPSCHYKPDGTYLRARLQHRQQNLPIRLAPITGETIASYLARLSAANHLPASFLLAHLPPWFTARSLTHDDLTGAARATEAEVEHLAALTGLNTATVLHALPAFRSGPHHSRPTVRATHACRCCAARHGHAKPVPVHLPAHQRVCIKHRLWLGDTIQIDLSAAPDIVHAHRRADRLARRHTGPRLIFTEVTERQQIISTRRHGTHPDPIERRITTITSTNRHLPFDHPDLIEAATYPETISNAANALRRSDETTTGPE
jgi:hypothetical protein